MPSCASEGRGLHKPQALELHWFLNKILCATT